MKTHSFRKLIRALRKNFPVGKPVVVKRIPQKGFLGLTRFFNKSYEIYIDPTICSDLQYDALMHEWAHVCAMDRAHSHDATWGVIYADIYDTMIERLEITVRE